jgi:hypothetical protein
LDSFVPGVNDTFTVLSAASIVGDFDTLDLPQLTSGLVWDYDRSSTAITLSVAAADFNRNGVTDTADYVLWRNTRNASVTPFSGADGSGNGVVDDADYAIWRANFGNTRGNAAGTGTGIGSSTSVPEPAAGVLAVCAGSLFVAQRKRLRIAQRAVDQA